MTNPEGGGEPLSKCGYLLRAVLVPGMRYELPLGEVVDLGGLAFAPGTRPSESRGEHGRVNGHET